MDPKVCGKLLTTHRRGYGVDVEASVIKSPSGRTPEKVPRWDLADTEGCGGGNSFSWCSWMFLGYVDIYRRRKSVRGSMRDPRGRGAPPWGAPCTLVAALAASWHPLQVSWIVFVPKRLLPKVSFHLDSVWYSFPLIYRNRQKQQFGLGLRLVG